MGESLTGTVIAAQITTGNTDNTFSIGDTNLMQGGHHQVETIADRDAITIERRMEGMLCYVISVETDPSNNPSVMEGILYRLVGGITNDNWVVESLSGTSGTSITLNIDKDNRVVKTIFNNPSVGEDGSLQQTGIRIDDNNNLILMAGTKLILDG